MHSVPRRATYGYSTLIAILFMASLAGVQPALARNEGLPPSAVHDAPPLATVEVLHLEPIDPDDLLARDEAKALGGPAPFRFAEAVDVEVTPQSHGTWHHLEDGGRLWRLRVSAPGATDLNLGFTFTDCPREQPCTSSPRLTAMSRARTTPATTPSTESCGRP